MHLRYISYIYIYKIKVFSVHWSKSRHILVAHVSNKVMNENTPNKIPVCLSVCLSVCFRGFREKLFTIHLKTAAGIIMKFDIWIRYLLTYVFNYITFWYLDPKMGFGGAHKYSNLPYIYPTFVSRELLIRFHYYYFLN